MKSDEMTITQKIRHYRDEAHIALWYPRNNEVKAIVLGLMDVRAADDIRIKYDFERDGWVVQQASTFTWSIDDASCDPDWQEVAFVQAWAREKVFKP